MMVMEIETVSLRIILKVQWMGSEGHSGVEPEVNNQSFHGQQIAE